MSKLANRTIGNENPQGKPRVYFAAYPEELNSFLDEYALKIQRIQDCAIWYETEYEAEYDSKELELQLSEMQLIVIPVTTKLLTKPNRAMDIEIPFARNKHIPILPIMMEDKLIDIYSKRFGNLQFINPNETDLTKRSFNEVLETYINAVLIGDEMAKKVRKAFDAYIFLSYRKKDRANAQKLMRLIHCNPLFQNVAIWYDEFLTPGEDFNDLILAMLKKSDVFALTVTPNLINEINYVMTTEYPVAKMNGKAILPVEMEITDKEELAKHYEGIPECITKENNEALLAELTKLFHTIAISEIDSDPEHSFLIGLAYLNGIDVEVDYKRAIQLITRAAEANIYEAIEQLITMYETGKGVNRDYHEGIVWRKKQVELLNQEYEKRSNDGNFKQYFLAIRSLGDAFYGLRLFKEANTAFTEMLSLAQKHSFNDKKEQNRRIADSELKLGFTAQAQGTLAEAKTHFEKAEEYITAIAEDTYDINEMRNLCACYDSLGYLAKLQSKMEEAKVIYEKLLPICLSLVEKTNSLVDKRTLSTTYERLGDIAKGTGKIEDAKDYYEKSLEVCVKQAEDSTNVLYRRDISVSYNKLGQLAEEQGNLEIARNYYIKSYTIRYDLCMETNTVEARRDYSVSLDNLGRIAEIQGNFKDADAYYSISHGISKTLTEEANTLEANRDLSISYENMGRIAEYQDELEKAAYYYEQSMLIWHNLAHKTQTNDANQHLFACLSILADIAQRQNKLDMAKHYYKASLEVLTVLSKENITYAILNCYQAAFHELGRIAEMQGLLEEARGYYMDSLRFKYAMANDFGALNDYKILQGYYCTTALFLLKHKLDITTAGNMLQSAVKIGSISDDPQIKEVAKWARKNLEKHFI